MRDEANGILQAIGQSWLTDGEFAYMQTQDTATEANLYLALSEVLNRRTAEGDAIKKLTALAILNNVEVLFTKKVENNILAGLVL